MMKKVIIFGNEAMARLVHAYFTKDSDYEIVGFTVDRQYIKDKEFLGLPLIPFEEITLKYSPEEYLMHIAIGYNQQNRLRAAKYEEAKKKGYKFANYISSKLCYLGDTIFGENCFITDNLTIEPFVKIGNNTIIWGGGLIGHDTVIKDHCYIAPEVMIGGFVTIGDLCFIGFNSTIRDHLTVADKCVIGAGAFDKERYTGKGSI